MVAMATPFKKTQKNYQKFIFGLKANFYAKFEENLETWTYHLFFILHESYVNLYLIIIQSTISKFEITSTCIWILISFLLSLPNNTFKRTVCFLPISSHVYSTQFTTFVFWTWIVQILTWTTIWHLHFTMVDTPSLFTVGGLMLLSTLLKLFHKLKVKWKNSYTEGDYRFFELQIMFHI